MSTTFDIGSLRTSLELDTKGLDKSEAIKSLGQLHNKLKAIMKVLSEASGPLNSFSDKTASAVEKAAQKTIKVSEKTSAAIAKEEDKMWKAHQAVRPATRSNSK